MSERSLDTSLVRTDHDNLVLGQTHVEEMLVQDRGSVEMVDGNVEEPLELMLVKIHTEDAIRPGRLDHVRQQLGADGDARHRSAAAAP